MMTVIREMTELAEIWIRRIGILAGSVTSVTIKSVESLDIGFVYWIKILWIKSIEIQTLYCCTIKVNWSNNLS